MGLFLAHVKIYHRYEEDDAEEYESRGRSLTLALVDKVIDVSDHCVKSSGVTCGAHIIAEDTDDG